jgi:hypothetical protein
MSTLTICEAHHLFDSPSTSLGFHLLSVFTHSLSLRFLRILNIDTFTVRDLAPWNKLRIPSVTTLTLQASGMATGVCPPPHSPLSTTYNAICRIPHPQNRLGLVQLLLRSFPSVLHLHLNDYFAPGTALYKSLIKGPVEYEDFFADDDDLQNLAKYFSVQTRVNSVEFIFPRARVRLTFAEDRHGYRHEVERLV